jgi:hypothetical protein
LWGGLPPVAGSVSEGGEGARRVLFSDGRGVFAAAPSECPVPGVFAGPGAARIGQKAGGVGGMVGEREAGFRAGFVADEAGGGKAGDAFAGRPVLSGLPPAGLLRALAAADFAAALALIGLLARGEVGIFRRSREEEAPLVRPQDRRALEAQPGLPAAFAQLRGARALAAPSVDRPGRAGAPVREGRSFHCSSRPSQPEPVPPAVLRPQRRSPAAGLSRCPRGCAARSCPRSPSGAGRLRETPGARRPPTPRPRRADQRPGKSAAADRRGDCQGQKAETQAADPAAIARHRPGLQPLRRPP